MTKISEGNNLNHDTGIKYSQQPSYHINPCMKTTLSNKQLNS